MRLIGLLAALAAAVACGRDLAEDECKVLTLGTDFAPICNRVGPERYRVLVTRCTKPGGDIEHFAACLRAG